MVRVLQILRFFASLIAAVVQAQVCCELGRLKNLKTYDISQLSNRHFALQMQIFSPISATTLCIVQGCNKVFVESCIASLMNDENGRWIFFQSDEAKD